MVDWTGERRIGAAVAAVLALASPIAALAAKQPDRLTVTVSNCGFKPRCPTLSPVTRGQVFYVLAQGYANPPANAVFSFVDASPCPSTYHDESVRARAHQALYIGQTAGIPPTNKPQTFGQTRPVSATRSALMPLGNDYVCSYLKDLLNPRLVAKPTYAHASARFTVNP